VPGDRLISTMGHALVDGSTEQKKNYNLVWRCLPSNLSFILRREIPKHIRMKTLSKLGILIVVGILTSCSKPAQQETKEKTQEPTVQAENQLPAMHLTMLNGATVDTKTLIGKVILVLFQTDCDHCQREAKEIRDNIVSFRDYTIYFITADQMPAIEKFGKDYDLLNHSNISFGMTSVNDVLTNFGSIPTPSVYVYMDRQLKHKFNGEVSINKILEIL